MAERVVTAALLGHAPPGLGRLLGDLMRDGGLRLELIADVTVADIVFAVVGRHDVVATICNIRKLGAERIVAVQPIRDDHAARRALDCGASVCVALDAPLDQLSFSILSLLACPTRAAALAFRLGPHARFAVNDLRAFSSRRSPPVYRIPDDAERRLEAATVRDWGRRLPRPFRLGGHGRREVGAMQLDLLAVERLERAIQADLDADVGRVA